MIKTLRIMMLGMLVMLGMSAQAEEIIWQEDWSTAKDGQIPENISESYASTGTVFNEDGTVKSGTKIYEANLAGGTSPELLVAKNGGSFTATIALNGKSGEMYLQFKTNRNDMKVEVEGATLGEKARSGNTDTYTVTVAAGTAKIAIIFKMTTSSNARLDDIKLYQGTAKKPAGLSWGKASTTVYMNDADSVMPKLQNENNLTVAYTSSEETVATIASNGKITLVAPGKTTFTAAFAGNDEYEAQSVSIEVTVKEAKEDNPEPQPEESISVAQALRIIAGLDSAATTKEEYVVKGYIVGAPDFQRKDDGSLYGNVNMTIADEVNGTNTLTVFRGKSYDNKNFTEETISLLEERDLVEIKGQLQKYYDKNLKAFVPELKNCYIISINGVGANISTVKADNRYAKGIYNLAGQRLNSLRRGLNIVDGKKIVVK